MVEAYANAVTTRKHITETIQKRNSTVNALIASCDTYDDLLSKALKGIEFYTKLETNVSKLLQRIKSSCKVQQEEREQMLIKNEVSKVDNISTTPVAPKLKDYLESRIKSANPSSGYRDPSLQYHQPIQNMGYSVNPNVEFPPGIRPAPLGSEVTDSSKSANSEPSYSYPTNVQYNYNQAQTGYSQYYQQQSQPTAVASTEQDLVNRMNSLLSNPAAENNRQHNNQQQYSSYIPQNYTPGTTYSLQTTAFTPVTPQDISYSYDATKAYTTTVNSYRPLSSHMPNTSTSHMQYPDSALHQQSLNDSTNSAMEYQTYSTAGFTQPIQTTTQSSGQNINTYYPIGYSPNYTGTPTQTNRMFSGQVQYHSLEYATSVAGSIPAKSYNSTYSSPIPNMTSAAARDVNYMSSNINYNNENQDTITNTSNVQQNYPYSSGGTEGATGYPNNCQQASTVSSKSVTQPISSTSGYYADNAGYASQNVSYPTNSSYSTGYTYPTSYATTNAYSSNSTSYPTSSSYSGYTESTSAPYHSDNQTFNNTSYLTGTQMYVDGVNSQQSNGYASNSYSSTAGGPYSLGGTTPYPGTTASSSVYGLYSVSYLLITIYY